MCLKWGLEAWSRTLLAATAAFWDQEVRRGCRNRFSYTISVFLCQPLVPLVGVTRTRAWGNSSGESDLCSDAWENHRLRSELGWRGGKVQPGGAIAGGCHSWSLQKRRLNWQCWQIPVKYQKEWMFQLFPWLTQVAGDKLAPQTEPLYSLSPVLAGGRLAFTSSSLRKAHEHVTHTCSPWLWGQSYWSWVWSSSSIPLCMLIQPFKKWFQHHSLLRLCSSLCSLVVFLEVCYAVCDGFYDSSLQWLLENARTCLIMQPVGLHIDMFWLMLTMLPGKRLSNPSFHLLSILMGSLFCFVC